ncbi:DEAD/DEAH box helicase, partial [Schaalia naturae]|uniref:DEAD/DEAH box helicase n=1 Tax=Schaalia naturae TaxID=635203 RepID=UPI0036353F1F
MPSDLSTAAADLPVPGGPASPSSMVGMLERMGARDGRLVHMHVVPARPEVAAAWPGWVDPRVVALYAAQGIDHLWRHQRVALDAIRAGSDTVVATGTGTGKSLAAWAPILSDLAQTAVTTRISQIHRRPTLLYMAPTKALAADQLAALERLLAGARRAGPGTPA